MTIIGEKLKTRFNRVYHKRICVGVTGLSQSGKSTFITSLINQLRQHDAKNSKLGKFTAAINHKIHLVKLHPLEDSRLPMYEYESSIAGLSGSHPCWPKSTTDISGILIELVLKNGKNILRRDTFKSVFIEIRDYPGEWLVDLPMMEMTFSQWSKALRRQLERSPRADMECNPLMHLSAVDPLSVADPVHVEQLNSRYVNFLRQCKKASPSLSLLQPGRFLQPGGFSGHPMMSFVPLTSCENIDETTLKKADKSSYFKVLEARYEEYKSKCIETFFNDFIAPVNKQVILIDVLNVLNGGEVYVEDMIETLDMISESFKYKKGFFSSSIKQVHFIATKVDHAFIRDHDGITHLLGEIVKRSLESIKDHKVKYKVDSVASVRSSVEDVDSITSSPAIRAYNDAGEVIKYSPPKVPDHIPEGAEWDAFSGWRWPKLGPPRGTRVSRDQAIQHIRMDYVIENLIGDLCD